MFPCDIFNTSLETRHVPVCFKTSEHLKDCFEETNWDIYFQSCQDVDELTDIITSYIKFCEEIFPDNKSWVSKQL